MKRTLPRACLIAVFSLGACGDSGDPLKLQSGEGDPSRPETVIEVNGPDGRPWADPIPDAIEVGGGEFPVDPVDATGAEPDADQPLGPDPHTDAGGDGGTASDAAEDAAIHDDAGDAGCVVRAAAEDVDLLFVIDNSGSMGQEQARLIEKLAQLVAALTAGDREAGKVSPRSDEYAGRRFTPPRSLHIGVTTANLGAPPGVSQTASPTCVPDNGGPLGNGQLLHSGATGAVDLVDLNTQIIVRRGVPECANVQLAPHYLAFGSGVGEVSASNAQAMQNALFQFSCVATVGVSGCGIEQQLESMWKALAPQSASDFVAPDTRGQGDRANAGFLRQNSVLAAVVVSDEDDCSVTSQGTLMFERTPPAGLPQVNVRCQLLSEDPTYSALIQPISRYAQGLLALRIALPERLVFAGIVGLPTSAVNLTDYSRLLADPRMQVQVDTSSGATDLVSVCGADYAADGGVAGGRAYPGRRFVHLAQAITAGGGNVVLQSICDDDYAPVVDALVERIGTQLSDGCTSADGGI